MASVEDGTYVVRSAYDTNLVIDSCGAEDRAGSNVQFYAYNGSDAQFVRVTNLGDGFCSLSFPATGRCLDVSGAVFATGTNVQQWDWNGSKAQTWTIVDTGRRKTVNGVQRPVFKVHANGSWNYEGVAWNCPSSGVPVYRAYHRSDHFFTANKAEYDMVCRLGWRGEGIGFYSGGDVPIYRVYNPGNGEHFYTANRGEVDHLLSVGWLEGNVAFYGVSTGGSPLYRLYDPDSGFHLFTLSRGEREVLSGGACSPWLLEGMDTASAHSGTNVCISTDEGTSLDQMWIFEPADPVPTGTYEIVSQSDAKRCLSVNGGSTGDGAAVMSLPRSGATGQCVWVREYDSTGRAKLLFTHSMKLMEISNKDAANAGDKVMQYPDDGGTDQEWILEPNGHAWVEKAWYPAFQIANYAASGTTLVVDASNVSDVRIQPMNNSAAQRFAFVPADALVPSLPTPGNVGFIVGGSVRRNGAFDYGVPRLYFECPGDYFKGRWRYRIGVVGSSGVVWRDWTAWMSPYTGDSANGGWGDAWKPNIIFHGSPNAKSTGTLTIPPLGESTLAVQLQGEVRTFAANALGNAGLYGVSNPGVSGNVTLAFRPTMTLGSIALSHRGIAISYTSNWKAGGNTIAVGSLKVNNVELLPETRRTTGLAGLSGTAYVDWANLLEIPEIGQSASAMAKMETGLLESAWASKSNQLQTVGNFRSINPTYDETDHGTYVLTPDTDGSARCFVKQNGRLVEMKRRKDGTFDVLVPLNTEVPALVVECDRNGTWGFAKVVLPAITSKAFIWSFGNDDWAVLDLGNNSVPTQDSKRERKHVNYETTGRDYVATRFSRVKSRDMSVTGVVVESIPQHGTKEAFVRLLDAGHASFRNYRGEIVNVAVTGITDSLTSKKLTEITVTQHQESR